MHLNTPLRKIIHIVIEKYLTLDCSLNLLSPVTEGRDREYPVAPGHQEITLRSFAVCDSPP